MSKSLTPQDERILTLEEAKAALESPETFAAYLVTLTPQQVRTFKTHIAGSKMDPEVKPALIALLDLAETEAEKNIREFEKTILPEAKRLALCLTLFDQIQKLEALEQSL